MSLGHHEEQIPAHCSSDARARRPRVAALRILATAVIVGALGFGVAGAKECNGIDFPEQMPADGAALTLNGLGLRQATMFKVNVYVAALYVPRKSSDPGTILDNAPAELILHFVRDVGAGDIAKSWNEGFENNAKADLHVLKDRIAMLDGWMTDVKSGQRMIFSFKPGTGVQVSVNGVAKGTIKGDDFAKALLSIWLGPEPPNPEIKAGLLGGACG